MNQQPQRLDIDFTITWEAGWHVGSGQGTATVDRLLRRRSCGPRGESVPFVPGSQIKGVLRHQCERLADLLGSPVVSPHVVQRDPDPVLLEHFCPLDRSEPLIDRLFGTRFQGECLFVEDAIPVSESPQPLGLHSRTAIDRVSGTARDRTLFVTQVAQADGLELRGRLQARHPAGTLTQDGDGFPYEYALLIAGLLSVDALGGDRSTGHGKCRVAVVGDVVRWNAQQSVSLKDALQSFDDLGDEWLNFLKDFRGSGKA